jgi:hypothetical protein
MKEAHSCAHELPNTGKQRNIFLEPNNVVHPQPILQHNYALTAFSSPCVVGGTTCRGVYTSSVSWRTYNITRSLSDGAAIILALLIGGLEKTVPSVDRFALSIIPSFLSLQKIKYNHEAVILTKI